MKVYLFETVATKRARAKIERKRRNETTDTKLKADLFTAVKSYGYFI
jgi:hypothetical protein